MPAVIHPIDSLWICDEDVDRDDDGNVIVDTIAKREAGPADSVKLRLPVEAYQAELLYRNAMDSEPDVPIAVLLKPTLVGKTMLFFGAAPTLRAFADPFFPF